MNNAKNIKYESVALHWYDSASREGYFKDSSGNNIYANFIDDSDSHILANSLLQGNIVEAYIVRDTTFTQIAHIRDLF